jgi:hypothetical protein
MKRDILVSLLFVSLIAICIISCKRKSEDTYTITGRVIDQVTMQPVAAATVYRGYKPLNDSYSSIYGDSSTTSGQDGKFSVVFSVTDFATTQNYPYIYASKPAYAGSSYSAAPKGGEVGSIELFHIAALRLRVKNDTTNILPSYLTGDDVYVSLEGQSNTNYPGFIGSKSWNNRPSKFMHCKGRKFDTVFVFYPLWSNVTYSVRFYSSEQISWSFPRAYYISPSIIIKPDSVAYFTASF